MSRKKLLAIAISFGLSLAMTAATVGTVLACNTAGGSGGGC